MLRFSHSPLFGVFAIATSLATAGAQQSEVSLSPFVTFLPTGTASPMAGLALSIAGGPIALRAGGHVSLQDRTVFTTGSASTSIVTARPWGADADALAYLESYTYGDRIGFTPYVFAGLSTSAVDSAARRMVRQGWSYGGGVTVPVAGVLGLFGETRWRMSKYVMPNANDAPPASTEFRIGVSFRIGGGGRGLGDVRELVREMSSGGGAFADAPEATNIGSRILSTASNYVGSPYRRGGTSPSGFDASGFVRFVFSRLGVTLPRASRDQARVGERVRKDWHTIAPGDLLLFEDDGGINHVAIYVGQSRIIHSSASGGGVRYDELSSDRGRWFIEHLVAVRRVTPDVRGLLLDLARGYPMDVGSNMDGPDHAPKVDARRRN